MVRFATEEDVDNIVTMAMKFADSSSYKGMMDENKIRAIVESLVKMNKKEGTILICEGGFLAAMTNPFMFGLDYIATEIAWWVDEDKRQTGLGTDLLRAFEEWAKHIGCKYATMISLDDKLGNLYERMGYKLYERAYMKEL